MLFCQILILMFKAVQISCPNLFSQVPQQFILWTYLEALLSPLMATTFGGSQYYYPGVFLETQELSGRERYIQRESCLCCRTSLKGVELQFESHLPTAVKDERGRELKGQTAGASLVSRCPIGCQQSASDLIPRCQKLLRSD